MKENKLLNTLLNTLIDYNSDEEYSVETLKDVLKFNIKDLPDAVDGLDTIKLKFDTDKISDKLRNKLNKRFKIIDKSCGSQVYFLASDDKDKLRISVPYVEKSKYAYISFKDFVRVKKFQHVKNRIESIMKRSKVPYTIETKKVNGVNMCTIRCTSTEYNEVFWGVLNLLTKG